MAKSKTKIEAFIEWLHQQLNSIYVWGAQGEHNLTDEQIRQKETSEDNAKRAIALKKKRQAEGMSVIRAFDCSGLVVCYLISRGYIKADMNAAGLCDICNSITRTQLTPGDLVFRHNGVRIFHVGVYVGDDMVIHSKGRDCGVVKEHISYNGESYWNRYGRLAVMQEQEGSKTMQKVIKKTNPLTKGDDVKQLQNALNALGYECGTPDGIAGDKTIAAIKAFCAAHAEAKMPDAVTVTIKAGTQTYTGTAKV